jgi:hypothetical protein
LSLFFTVLSADIVIPGRPGKINRMNKTARKIEGMGYLINSIYSLPEELYGMKYIMSHYHDSHLESSILTKMFHL